MNKYLIASLAALTVSVAAFTLEYKFDDDSEVIQNAVESSIINPENIKFVKIVNKDETDDMKPLQMKELNLNKVEASQEVHVNSKMDDTNEEVAMPDYLDIQKVPIEQW